ncbi:MAG: ROK family protein [Pseudomonadota bacterium]
MMQPDPHLYHGLDIGGSKIELVAFRATADQLHEVHRERIPTPVQDFAHFVAAIGALVARGDKALGGQAVVGVGLPGIADAATGRHLSSNVPALNGRVVAPALESVLQRPVVIGNDCHCFALSEALGGAADKAPTMFGAILGTGAGGGYCIGGRLQAGLNGIAGEWGHWSVPAHLLARYDLPVVDCPCGRRGCVERYVSGPGMSMLHSVLGGNGDEAATIAAAAATDQRAGATVAAHLDLLAHALSNLVLSLDPHVIVLGGGLSRLPYLYRDLPCAVQRHLFAGTRVPPILPPRFGDAGGARGAALLARQHMKKTLS